jgi:ribulose 1,5-bisphosphate carboxylase large subunit-like protein
MLMRGMGRRSSLPSPRGSSSGSSILVGVGGGVVPVPRGALRGTTALQEDTAAAAAVDGMPCVHSLVELLLAPPRTQTM